MRGYRLFGRAMWVVRIVLALALLFGVQVSRSGADVSGALVGGTPLVRTMADGPAPTPAVARSRTPLGVPLPPPAEPGEFAFLQTDPTTGAPVTYDPCRPIHVVVNSRTAPPGGDKLVTEAVHAVRDVTGLKFVYDGPTDEVPVARRAAFQRERYGDRWAPVLIAWSDGVELPELAGNAGIGGSVAVPASPKGPSVYVTGIIALNGPALASVINTNPIGRMQARATIVHELGHLLGLDHVPDPREVMHGGPGGSVDLQAGDLAGLSRVGAGPCVERL